MHLVYIGEDLPASNPDFIKAFQDQQTGKQFNWDEVKTLVQAGAITIRPATFEELEFAGMHAEKIQASIAYLSQFYTPRTVITGIESTA